MLLLSLFECHLSGMSSAWVGGKTARPCDSCVTKRARWYCAADDAFLCQACDSSVHSANPLARRHQRVRLKTASLVGKERASSGPCWFRKKARSPRQGKGKGKGRRSQTGFHLVPEEGSEEVNSQEENEEQFLYRVPVMPSDAELAEFAADVESLLGRGMEDECVGMEELGLLDGDHFSWGDDKTKAVKAEPLYQPHTAPPLDVLLHDDAFELSFDYGDVDEDQEVKEKEKEKLVSDVKETNQEQGKRKRRKILLLDLDYEGIITAWSSSKKSPWTTGFKPTLDLHDCWPHCMGSGSEDQQNAYGVGYGGCNPVMGGGGGDGGREARVSRYREKRRTRLFSKKIRYEVRKLNAEKRPRMKGRFVKRPSFPAPALAPPPPPPFPSPCSI